MKISIFNFQFSISHKLMLPLSKRSGFTLTGAAGQAKSKRSAGFTLIELLIVMAILGALGVVFVNTFPASQRRARDTQRISDLKQYQTALELFANRNNGNYVNSGTVKPASFCSTQLGLTNCPEDPRDGNLTLCTSGTCQYQYVSSGTTGFGLWARLESPNVNTSAWFIICSRGLSGQAANPTPSAGDICGSLDP